MRPVILLAAVILLPLAGAILLGLLQRAVYVILLSRGRIQPDKVPPFLVLFARGLIGVVAVAIAMAIATRFLA